MGQITIKNMHMSADDMHRAIQTGLALRIIRRLKLPMQNFDNVPIEEIEKFVTKHEQYNK